MNDAETLQAFEDLKGEAEEFDLVVELNLITSLIDVSQGSSSRSFETVGEALSYVFGWADREIRGNNNGSNTYDN